MGQACLPIVRSWTGWNLLSVNCSNRHDFPTPEKQTHTTLQRVLKLQDWNRDYRVTHTAQAWTQPRFIFKRCHVLRIKYHTSQHQYEIYYFSKLWTPTQRGDTAVCRWQHSAGSYRCRTIINDFQFIQIKHGIIGVIIEFKQPLQGAYAISPTEL